MFERCDFLLGKDETVVIVIAGHLPKADNYTVSVSDHDIRFRAGYEDVASIPYEGGEVFKRIARNMLVGLMEYSGAGALPSFITNVAYVEVRRSMA